MNGFQIGVVQPRPWLNHPIEPDYEAVSFVIPSIAFPWFPFAFGFPFNSLQIRPSGAGNGSSDYILFANMWLHYPQT